MLKLKRDLNLVGLPNDERANKNNIKNKKKKSKNKIHLTINRLIFIKNIINIIIYLSIFTPINNNNNYQIIKLRNSKITLKIRGSGNAMIKKFGK